MESKIPLESLRIVGAMGEQQVDVSDIQQVLQQQQQELGRDGDFIGKSTTTLFANDTHVIKLHPSQRFDDAKIAHAWVGHHVEGERDAKVYHPLRCWFILLLEGHWISGNITPRLQPVHHVFESLEVLGDQEMAWLMGIIDTYLDYAVRMDKRLDEGLSNFGLDGDKLYYLDDDIFEWDAFHALSALIAGWVRRYSATWFDEAAVHQFAVKFDASLKHYFHSIPGLDASQVVAEQLNGMFFPQGHVQQVAKTLVSVLRYGDGCEQACSGGTHKNFNDLEVFSKYFEQDEPIAILADVHANLPALEVVLTEIHRRGIERIFVLGDLVGYGPHPEACIRALQKVGAVSLRGNHDHTVGTGSMVRSMTSSSSWTAEWTIACLSEEHRSYLKQLPLRMLCRPWIAMHGAPVDKTFFNAYVYNRTAESNLIWLQKEGYRFALHGHSHMQGVYALNHFGQVLNVVEKEIDLMAYPTSLICPGSVGQPRDGQIGAAFAILKPQSAELELLCLPYDVHEVLQDMVIAQFPEQLIHRLKIAG